MVLDAILVVLGVVLMVLEVVLDPSGKVSWKSNPRYELLRGQIIEIVYPTTYEKPKENHQQSSKNDRHI